MRYWFWLIALLLPALAACSNSDCKLRVNGICYDKQRESDPPLKARWQIFDADSGKPLEGVWINFLWYGKSDSRGMRRCVGAVLGRTDADGIFEATAKDGSWRFGGQPPTLFKRDYQPLQYKFWGMQTDVATANVDVQYYERDAYPAWFKRLEALGYKHVDEGGTTTHYDKKYSTALIKDGMGQHPYAEGGRKEFWVTRRTLPAYASAPGVGAMCKYATTDNVGFDEATLRLLSYERAMHAYTYLCDPQWDTIPADYKRTSSRIFVHQSLWLLNDEEHSFNRALKIIPDYLGGPYKALDSEDRALRPEERIALCDWLAPYTQAPTKSMEP
ncbi:MAG TPA: hypothetical protein PLB00_04445 [Pseudomonadota bacterium]|nr:hypothetical protein [Pseudomonadota bacterium]